MGDDLTPFSWNVGSAFPSRTFGGVKILESEYLPGDQAVMLPGGEFVVPKGMADRITSIATDGETRDIDSYGSSFGRSVVVNNRVTASTSDGTDLTVEKIAAVQGKIREIMDRKMGAAFGLSEEAFRREFEASFDNHGFADKYPVQIHPEPRDHLADLEQEAMQTDPAWGSF